MQSNLLVTYNPAHPGKAEREVRALLDDFGAFEFVDSTVQGVFLIHVEGPKNIISKMRKLPADSFENTFKWVPIETWVSSDVKEMSKALKGYNEKIGEDESWKLMLFKRQYDDHSTTELIKLLTEHIERKNVDLKNPEKLVVVEIVGDKAGLSLLDKDEYLDTQKL
ncbi:MAG: THUMP domain-containing protein [Candidatus Aenigmarchaeota archaeon]|nr:THUMP domain-containing protein [Candidatus Aenigmarchaeota archaeon]